MPRTRKSRTQKILTGTHRPDRERTTNGGLDVLKRVPPAPDGLSAQATAVWQHVGQLAIKLGTLTKFDVPLLELTARTLGSVAELEQLLREEGLILTSGDVRKAHPAATLLERSRAQAHRLLADLGLTPTSRERISFPAPSSGNNPFTGATQ